MKDKKIITSCQYKEQPGWFTLVNKLWRKTYPLGTKSVLTKESLMDAAKKATGLNDFGTDFWEEPLEVMLKSIQEEAQLHPIGQFITRQRLINLLSVRLRAEHYFKKHPEILEQEIYLIPLLTDAIILHLYFLRALARKVLFRIPLSKQPLHNTLVQGFS